MVNQGFTGEHIPATKGVFKEAENLSADILADIELSRSELSVIVLKALRLARLLNDFEAQQIFEWESVGYSLNDSGKIGEQVLKVARQTGRTFFRRDSDSKVAREVVSRDSIEQLERIISMGEISLQASSNASERLDVQKRMFAASERLSSRRTLIYGYALRKNYELRFSGFVDDVFGRVRTSVDASVGLTAPDSVKKLTAVYDNLGSDNPEDWANAAHSCRRVLQDVADSVFPAQSEPRIRNVNGKDLKIKLGPDQYINRLVAYIEDTSKSDRFIEIVGSHMKYMGDRLDAVFHAAQKGSHATVTKAEADRYVIYTYLLVGDILSLHTPSVDLQVRATEVDTDEIDID